MAMGLCSEPSTHAPSHNSCTGHTRAQVAPSKLDSRMVRAEPGKLPVEIFLMNLGMSIWVGQACVQGASKHIKQRADSVTASCSLRGGSSSWSAEPATVTEGISLNKPPEDIHTIDAPSEKKELLPRISAQAGLKSCVNSCAIEAVIAVIAHRVAVFPACAFAIRPSPASAQSLD